MSWFQSLLSHSTLYRYTTIASLDLLSIEWPVGDAAALNATWAKLEALVDAGKTKAIGLTNASVPIVEAICKAARIKPAVIEVEAHPLMAHRKLMGVCRRYGRVVTPGEGVRLVSDWCQIGYMDYAYTGCHQLNRVLTAK
jgi:diketogulonate reductase-like aldo/keto reductase